MASTSRMLARNLFPRPSPLEAPLTRPAMSTNSMTAGVIFSGSYIFASASSRVVRHGNDADVWLDGAEGVVGRLRAGVGDCIKKCALADVRQTHDTKFHIDSFLSISEKSRYTFIISFVDSLGKSCAAKIEDG